MDSYGERVRPVKHPNRVSSEAVWPRRLTTDSRQITMSARTRGPGQSSTGGTAKTGNLTGPQDFVVPAEEKMMVVKKSMIVRAQVHHE